MGCGCSFSCNFSQGHLFPDPTPGLLLPTLSIVLLLLWMGIGLEELTSRAVCCMFWELIKLVLALGTGGTIVRRLSKFWFEIGTVFVAMSCCAGFGAVAAAFSKPIVLGRGSVELHTTPSDSLSLGIDGLRSPVIGRDTLVLRRSLFKLLNPSGT